MEGAFQRDCLNILAEKLRTGEISRRQFAQLAGAVLVGTVGFRIGPSKAAAGSVVFVNWGGDAIKAYDVAYGKPFERETGIVVNQDGSGPTESAIMAQFRSGKPSWDICDISPSSAIALGNQGAMQKIDYTVVDKSRTRSGFGWDYAACTYFFSYIIAYDRKKYDSRAPAGMADFFDVQKFPGKRTLYKWGTGMWEAALLADGVPADKLYPLDLDRAHKRIRELKPHISSFWGTGAASQSLLMNGDAVMGIIWSTRASLLHRDSNGQIAFTFDQGLLSPGAMAVLANNPAGRDIAMKFIASAQDPQKQLVMFEILGQGPANPAADALIPLDKKWINCVDPANMIKQVALDMDWYAQNYGKALEEYTKVIGA